MGDRFHDDATFQNMHERLHAVSLQNYNKLTEFGGEVVRSEYREYLKLNLERAYRNFKDRNDAVKVRNVHSIICE